MPNSKRKTESTEQDLFSNYEKIYAEDLPAIKAYERDSYYKPTLSYTTYIEEAEGYIAALPRVQKALEKEGFPPELGVIVFRNVAAARVAEARLGVWTAENKQQSAIWKEKYTEAQELRHRLLKRIGFIAKERTDLQEAVNNISEGRTISDFIHDLLELATVGVTIVPELEKLAVTKDELMKAKELAETLGGIHKLAQLDRSVKPEVRIIRDKAFTILNDNLNKLQDWIDLVFEKDAAIIKIFHSQRNRKRRKPVAKTVQANEEQQGDSRAKITDAV